MKLVAVTLNLSGDMRTPTTWLLNRFDTKQAVQDVCSLFSYMQNVILSYMRNKCTRKEFGGIFTVPP